MLFLKSFFILGLPFLIFNFFLLSNIPKIICLLTNCKFCLQEYKIEIINNNNQERISTIFLQIIKDFLKFFNYVSIDTSINEIILSDSNTMEIDTFAKGNKYKVNEFGYCKISEQARYCYCNENNGMDLFSILIRDIGIQIGLNSRKYINESKIIGDTTVFSYQVGLDMMSKYMRRQKKIKNDNESREYSKMVIILKLLIKINKMNYYSNIIDIILIIINLILITMLFISSIILIDKRYGKSLKILKVFIIGLIINRSLNMILKTANIYILREINNNNERMNMIKYSITIGSGFKLDCISYLILIIYCNLSFFVVIKAYAKREIFNNEDK